MKACSYFIEIVKYTLKKEVNSVEIILEVR